MPKQKFTAAQAKMLKASDPSDRDPTDGAGVELRGAMFATARRLEEMGLGVIEGDPGQELPALYFNNADGLYERRQLLGIPETGEEEDDDDA